MNKDYFFTYKGLNSNEFGLKIKTWNYLDSPERNFEEVEVPGKNGSVFVDHGNYKNRPIDIVCLIDLRGLDKNSIGTRMNEWLLLDMNYHELRISDDEEHYFEATCINKLSFSEIMNDDYFELIISFSAKPFKKANDNEVIEVKKGQVITVYNDSKIEAEPLIKVFTSTTGTVCSIGINNTNYTFKNHPQKEFIIDSELMHVYREVDGLVENYNEYYFTDDFPIFNHGENKVSLSGNIDRIEIYPNIKYL